MTHSLPYAAVIFDLDGTLIDTEALFNETGAAACAALGHPVGVAFFEDTAGTNDAERARLIAIESGQPVDLAAFCAEWDRLSGARFADGIPLKPGVPALLDAVAALGLPMALCTSSRRSQANAKMEITGLGRYFAATITCDDVDHAKPAPDPYLAAAAALAVEAARCLVFEDSETGARSAHAAGMVVVQTPDLHPATGNFAHFVSDDIMTGARLAGLIA